MKKSLLFAKSLLLIAFIFWGCSKKDNNITVELPGAPTNLTASVISVTRVDLMWNDNSTNESGYKVQRKTPGASFADIAITAADLTAFSDTGLTPNTTYTYRVYSFNAAGNSQQYSNEVTVTTNLIPIITTASVSSVSATGAVSGGNITSDAGSPVTARGICWDTASGPTILMSTKTSDGTGTGSFISNMTGLNPGRTYYVRAYATSAMGTAYGNELSFSTQAVLLITTNPVSSITAGTALSGGNISSDGGSPVTARGVCWSTVSGPTILLPTKTSDGAGAGSFISNMTGLNPGTTYYVRAYATNTNGTVYGNEESFSTQSPLLINTTNVYSIAATTAVSGGNIISDGGSAITGRGVCWSIASGPTISLSTKTSDGTGTGNFASNITGLNANIRYYVRAYATNANGTVYGNEVSFITSATPATIFIGSQMWQTGNLSVSNYQNGDPIPYVSDPQQWAATTSGAWCWYQNDSAAYAATYGKLYNWFAVSDPRGLAPSGWHVPSDAEWTTMETTLGGATVAGGALKESGTAHWTSPNTGATNSSGFTALPGGMRNLSAVFSDLSSYGRYWSSTESSSTNAWCRYVWYNGANLVRFGNYDKNYGLSVRLIKD